MLSWQLSVLDLTHFQEAGGSPEEIWVAAWSALSPLAGSSLPSKPQGSFIKEAEEVGYVFDYRI